MNVTKLSFLAIVIAFGVTGCSPEAESVENDIVSETLQTKSIILEPETEYEDILNAFYDEYEVGEWTTIVDEAEFETEVKEVINSNGSTAYLIKDPEDGHYVFVDRNDVTEMLYFRDLSNGTDLNFSFAGQLPIKVEPGDGDAGVVTNGWFRGFSRRFFGAGQAVGGWSGCIGGLQYRTVTPTFTVLFMEFQNGESGQQSQKC
jgi:hypothetical protein